MTWRTEIGERVIVGQEAALLREAIAGMATLFEEDLAGDTDPWKFGVPIFDRLEPLVKLALLAEVGTALLLPTDRCPPLTAVSESVIGAMFRHIDQSVQYEIDCWDDLKDRTFSWRRILLEVMKEIGEDEDLPDSESSDYNEWSIILEVLKSRILWDEDFNDADFFLDMDADKAEAVKAFASIDEDYFRAVPPNPRESDLPRILSILEKLTEGA